MLMFGLVGKKIEESNEVMIPMAMVEMKSLQKF